MAMHSRSVLVAALVCFACAARANPSEAAWKAFRQVYPYHVQGIALSEPASDGTRTMIVAEPPPHVTLESLKQLDPLLAAPKVETLPIGFDGWVKDVRFELPADLPPRRLRALTDRLHIHLFGTAYKAYVISISPSENKHGKLNLEVTAADLAKWLFELKEGFTPFYGGAPMPIQQVLARQRSGVYYSVKPGLVALVLPRRAPISAMRADLRRFAVDTDLILGATAAPSHIAILARERNSGIDMLPPLRVETMLTLASTRSKELAQSYERTNFFSGRIEDADTDWAPIYLSDILIDTEYGSLLNITDQLLKSWSCSGEVRYARFSYPAPSGWPFQRPIPLDANAQEITFNWNTKGAGYVAEFGERALYALNRTGSLPVSYIPGEIDTSRRNPLAQYENVGYRWFSNTGDPNLARVVQYAALYQIFQEYGIHDNSIPPRQYAHPEWSYLSGVGTRILQGLIDFKPEDIEKTSFSFRKEILEIQYKLKTAPAAERLQLLPAIGARLANPRIDEDLLRDLRAGARQVTLLDRRDRLALEAHVYAQKLRESRTGQRLSELVGSSKTLYKQYAEEADSRTSGWIRTPSIVLSSTRQEMSSWRGGHNLDSRILRYRTSAAVAEGDARVVEEGGARVVLLNPKDVEKVPGLLRTTALTPSNEELPGVLRRTLQTTPRASNLPRSTVLNLPEPVLGSPRGFGPGTVEGGRFFGGWGDTPAQGVGRESLFTFSGTKTRSIQISKTKDFSFSVWLPEWPAPRAVESYDAVVDMVTSAMKNVDGPAGSWNLQLEGFSQREARNLIRTTEVHFTSKERLNLAGFSRPEGVSSERMFKALSERYDFRRAKIVETVAADVPDDVQAADAVRITAEIPSVFQARPPLLMRIRLFFRSKVSEPVRQAVGSAVARLLRRAIGSTGAIPENETLAQTILSNLKRDLKALDLPEAHHVDFQIEVNTDFGDFLVSELRVETDGRG